MFIGTYMRDTSNTTTGKHALSIKHFQRQIVYPASSHPYTYFTLSSLHI